RGFDQLALVLGLLDDRQDFVRRLLYERIRRFLRMRPEGEQQRGQCGGTCDRFHHELSLYVASRAATTRCGCIPTRRRRLAAPHPLVPVSSASFNRAPTVRRRSVSYT